MNRVVLAKITDKCELPNVHIMVVVSRGLLSSAELFVMNGKCLIGVYERDGTIFFLLSIQNRKKLAVQKPYNESEILRLVSGGDEFAFRILFDHYKERFYAVVLKMTRSDDVAQEMVQEIFLKIWQNRSSLTRVEHADAYFFTILYRQVFSHYKKLALERKLHTIISESPSFQNITDEMVLARESERLIQEAVTRLPRQRQLVYLLSKQDGLSREEIAEKLEISPNTVKAHLAEAMKSIRAYIRDAAFVFLLLIILLF